MSPHDIAVILKVTVMAVRKWIYKNRLPALRLINGYYKVKVSDFEAFMRIRQTGPQHRIMLVDALQSESVAWPVEEIESALKNIGIVVTSASSYADVIIKMAERVPSMVVVNLDTINGDPLAVIQAIRERRVMKRVKIIIVAAELSSEQAVEAANLNVSATLQLPLRIPALVREVEQILMSPSNKKSKSEEKGEQDV